MRPMNTAKDLASILSNKPILLLNKRIFAHRYTLQLLSLPSTKNILPAEIWNAIFDIMLNSEDTFCWIQIISYFPKQGLLHCREVSFEFPRKPRDFKNKRQVEDFESFLNNDKRGKRFGRRYAGEDKIEEMGTFAMRLPSPREAFVYLQVQVFDAIRYMGDSTCNLCLSRRVIVPEPFEGKTSGLHVFEHADEIICPLCIGVLAAQRHSRKLKELFDNNHSSSSFEGLEDWAHDMVHERGYEIGADCRMARAQYKRSPVLLSVDSSNWRGGSSIADSDKAEYGGSEFGIADQDESNNEPGIQCIDFAYSGCFPFGL